MAGVDQVVSGGHHDRTVMKVTRVGQDGAWSPGCGDRISWLLARPIEAPEISRVATGPHRFRQDRGATLLAATMVLSLAVHAAALTALLLLSDRTEPPAAQAETSVALLFEAAPTVHPPAADVAPQAPRDIVPTRDERSEPETPADAPVPSRSETPTPTAPAPAPLPAASAPVPEPGHVAKTPLPPAPVPPPKWRAIVKVHRSPVRLLTSSARPDSHVPAETRSPAHGSVKAAVTASLVPPRPVAGMETNRAPEYPEAALRRREQGHVMLRVSVSADGTPLEVDLAQTSGHPRLDSAALSAVRRWRFIPAMQSGRPTPAIAIVPIRFRLDN